MAWDMARSTSGFAVSPAASPSGSSRGAFTPSTSPSSSNRSTRTTPISHRTLQRTLPTPTLPFENLNINGTGTGNPPDATSEPEPPFVRRSRRNVGSDESPQIPVLGTNDIDRRGLFNTYRDSEDQSISSRNTTERRRTSVVDLTEGEDQADETLSRRTSMDVDDQTDTFHHEPLPSAPIYNSQLQDGLKEVKSLLAEIANTMRLSELTDDPNTSLHKLHEETKMLSEFSYPETRTVGLIGDSGVGELPFLDFCL